MNVIKTITIIQFSKRRLKRALPESEWSEYTLKDSATMSHSVGVIRCEHRMVCDKLYYIVYIWCKIYDIMNI